MSTDIIQLHPQPSTHSCHPTEENDLLGGAAPSTPHDSDARFFAQDEKPDDLSWPEDQCAFPKGEIDDVLRGGHGVDHHTGLPQIQTNNRQLREIIDDAHDALVATNTALIQDPWKHLSVMHDRPLVFRRGGRLVYLKVEDGAAPELAFLDRTGVTGILTRDADFMTIPKKGDPKAASPPREVAQQLVVFPSTCLPRLDAVITTPVFSRRGTLIAKPGFHEDDALWLHPDPAFVVPTVPYAPTSDNVAHARSLFFDDLLVDFPFVADADRAHALAAMLLPFVRRLIEGNTPLHLVEAPSIGTGKGLFCNLVSVVATGRSADFSTLPGEEEEVRKTITAELLRAQAIIIFDNAKERKIVDSQALTSALTAPTWRNRILGRTEIISLPNYALWMLTGNNPRLSQELCRRSVRIRLDPKLDRAWQRSDFKHDPIALWAAENRSKLVHAALVLVQAWIAAGRPLSKKRLGSFESWAGVMGGLLDVIGVSGFLDNLDQMYADADAEGEAWRDFAVAWWERSSTAAVRVGELNELCEKFDLMTTVRGEGTERAQQVRLGKALQSARDRVYGELRITQPRNDKHRGRCYALEHLSTGHDAPNTEGTKAEMDDVDPLLQYFTRTDASCKSHTDQQI